MQVRVVEGRVTQAIAKFIDGRLVALVKVAVVNEDTLREVDLRRTVSVVGLSENLGTVVLLGLTPGEGALAARVDVAVENIGNGVSGFLARQASPDDSGDVGVVVPFIDQDGTGSVHNHDGVVAVFSDSFDHIFAVLPERQVLPVTRIAVHFQETLSSVGVDKDKRHAVALRVRIYTQKELGRSELTWPARQPSPSGPRPRCS